ncbi:DUF3310 domain-containing protein [Flavobacteriaceae bacterium]|nr:DUF3310 domain-containing protein [Flavobacteriaceae bacterium]
MSHYEKQAEQTGREIDRLMDNFWKEYLSEQGEAETQERCFRNFTPEQENKYKKNKEVSWIHKQNDSVQKPSHYQLFGTEAIEIIAGGMTATEFKGYCLGNFLKYRMRMGEKGDMLEDYNKSNKYKELFEQHKKLCKPELPF